MHWIFANEAWHQMVVQQCNDRTATRANGVRIACGLDAITAHQGEQNGFLRDKGLNRVGANKLGRQVHLPQMNAIDGD
jgi:hypothetical protein